MRVSMTLTARYVWRSAMRASTPAVFSRGQGTYTQGQSPEPRIREYFYYLDHQGQHLNVNSSDRYRQHFPFLSLCGRERNFLRCDDQPVVFTHLLSESGHLSYCGGGTKLTYPFHPQSLLMHPDSGRVYHPAPQLVGGVGLVHSALSMEFSPHFQYSSGQDSSHPPTHYLWDGQRYTLTNELLSRFAVK